MVGPAGNSEAAVRALSCVGRITKGMAQQLTGILGRCSSGACRIVNKTGRAVVVRAKYKDVWEGEQWRLAEGAEMLVPPHILKDGDPYSRLGAFIGEDVSVKKSLPLYIGSHHFLTSHQITLTLAFPPSPILGILSN